MVDVQIVQIDPDWEGLYINGKLVYEAHSIHRYELFDALRGAGIDAQYKEHWVEWDYGADPNGPTLHEDLETTLREYL